MDVLRDAALALGRGEPLRALGLVGTSEDARSRLLKGIAYAQMGDLDRGREVLLRAFLDAKDALTKTRIKAALVEIDLERGDLEKQARGAEKTALELVALGDVRNAAMQRLTSARALVLLGRPLDASRKIDDVLASGVDPSTRAVALLARAEVAVRTLSATRAKAALDDASRCLASAPNALLARAVASLGAELSRPIARIADRGVVRDADLFAVEQAADGTCLLVDGCRRVVVAGRANIPLARRPVLFVLLASLARAWPRDVARDDLVVAAFGARRPNDSHRVRLRVEIGRLRKVLTGIAEPVATSAGYELASTRDVLVLLPVSDDDDARIATLLADGAAWSAREVAEHAGISLRTAQRALTRLAEGGAITRVGRTAKASRYASTTNRIASRLLLLGLVPANHDEGVLTKETSS